MASGEFSVVRNAQSSTPCDQSVTKRGTDELFSRSPNNTLIATFLTVRAGLRYLNWSKTRTVPTPLLRIAKATKLSAEKKTLW